MRRVAFRALTAAPAAILVMAAAAEPASTPQPDLKVGDGWVFDSTVEQGQSGFADNRVEVRIEDVRDDGLLVGFRRQGAPVAFQDQQMGPDWSERRIADGRPVVGERPFDFPLTVGKTWEVDYDDPTRHGLQTSAHVHKTFKVTGWEDVHTPAGDFHALRIEAHGTIKAQIAAGVGTVGGVAAGAGDATTVVRSSATPAHVGYATTYARIDYVPQIKSIARSVHETYNAAGVRVRRETRTLESYKPAA